jgi:hypothetical protein
VPAHIDELPRVSFKVALTCKIPSLPQDIPNEPTTCFFDSDCSTTESFCVIEHPNQCNSPFWKYGNVVNSYNINDIFVKPCPCSGLTDGNFFCNYAALRRVQCHTRPALRAARARGVRGGALRAARCCAEAQTLAEFARALRALRRSPAAAARRGARPRPQAARERRLRGRAVRTVRSARRAGGARAWAPAGTGRAPRARPGESGSCGAALRDG